jgi:hypothetical protein
MPEFILADFADAFLDAVITYWGVVPASAGCFVAGCVLRVWGRS